MDEQKSQAKEEQPAEDTGEGDKFQSTPVINSANKAAERLEQANRKQEELLKKQEELMARQALGGRSAAGEGKEEKKEMTEKEYAKALQRGEVNPLKEDGFI